LGRWLTLQGQQSPCYDLRSSLGLVTY